MYRFHLFIIIVVLFIDLIYATNYTCDPTISCGCSTETIDITARIVGGEIAPDHAWAWTVSLQLSGSHRCTAMLIAPEYALTAAHCVDGVTYAPIFSIKAGTNYLNDTSAIVQQRQILDIYVHPKYEMLTHIYDIAVLRFSALTISSNSTIGFACLPTSNTDPFPIGSDVIAAGWGKTSESSTSSVSDYLRQVTLQILSPTSDDCKRAPIKNSTLQICAGVIGGGKGMIFFRNFLRLYCICSILYFIDTCNGDSGGPLMSYMNNRWIVAGLTSSGIGCARAGYPGIYTRVSSLISFIESTMHPQTPTKNNARNQRDIVYQSVLIFIFLLFSMTKI